MHARDAVKLAFETNSLSFAWHVRNPTHVYIVPLLVSVFVSDSATNEDEKNTSVSTETLVNFVQAFQSIRHELRLIPKRRSIVPIEQLNRGSVCNPCLLKRVLRFAITIERWIQHLRPIWL